MQPPANPTDKASWRTTARSLRGQLDLDAWTHDVGVAVRSWARYRDATTVALYLAFGSEVDLSALLQDDKRFYAPRTPTHGRDLRFHAVREPLERHRYGMHEPPADAPEIEPRQIDLVLVPGLLFDRSGARLGYGGGYYDAWLTRLPPDVPRVGVTHDALVVERLPTGPHDVAMTHLALPGGVVTCGDAG